MQTTHVVGVDPGLVHTGVVRLVFVPKYREIHLGYEAVAGPNAYAVGQWIRKNDVGIGVLPQPYIWIEKYQPRSHFATDGRMSEAVDAMKRETRGSVLLNTGVKKIVRRPLMELCGVWSFATVTNHQDLRAAARILLYGMLKNDTLNQVLYAVVHDHLEGKTWRVHQ